MAIDDGNKLLTTTPVTEGLAPVTALVSQGPTLTQLFVLDAGLRPFAPGDLVLTLARPAAVFRVDPRSGPASIRPVTENGNLVYPTGMATHDGQLLICDPGQPASLQQNPVLSRLSPFRFCVVVHFESLNLPDDEQQRRRVIGRVVASIRSVVDELRPAHTLGELIIAG